MGNGCFPHNFVPIVGEMFKIVFLKEMIVFVRNGFVGLGQMRWNSPRNGFVALRKGDVLSNSLIDSNAMKTMEEQGVGDMFLGS